MKLRARLLFLAILVSIASLSCNFVIAQAIRPRVRGAVDNRSVVSIQATVPIARLGALDEGVADSSTALNRMQLVLKRSPEQEAMLRQLIEQQQDSSSPHYHQWLTPEAFGASFGLADSDVAATTGWLAAQGFTRITVNTGRTVIEFSGSAGEVERAFHSSVHRYRFNSSEYLASVSALKVPVALAPVIAGLASLNGALEAGHTANTRLLSRDVEAGRVTPRAAESASATNGPASPDYTTTASGAQTVYAITPYDFAAIYNVTPLWNSQIDGTKQTIAVVGQSDINPEDFVNFRALFNLPIDANNSPTKTAHLNIIYNGPNPGFNSDEITGNADTQWSGAVAKGATINYVASQTTAASEGSDLSAVYIVDNNLASVMVDSFSRCERTAGSGYDAFITNLWQQAAAQGITVVVAAGESGSAACDATNLPAAAGTTPVSTEANQGLAVNAIASTPYDVAVGGTDFYMPSGGTSYWSATNDGTTQASAKGYIPEAVWNDSCANPNYSAVTPYNGESPQQVCNNRQAATDGLVTVRGGGGGVSNCTQSSGGSCTGGTAKPSWQTGAGVPNDNLRDLPDVSMFSGDGAFGSLYFVCQQSADPSSSSCALGKPSVNFVGTGGTSLASAAFAGVMALVNQKVAQQSPSTPVGLGNANYTLYALANQQAKTGAGCNATGSLSASCIFHDITLGTNAMPCVAGSLNCNGSGVGILSGYSAAANYDLASGLGSINVANLVDGWQSVIYLATTTTLGLSPQSIVHGQAVAASVNVTSASGTPIGQVSINADAANGSVGDGTLASGSFSASYTTFPGGTYQVHAFYGGDGTFAASESVPVELTVTPEASITTEKLTDQNNQPVTGTIPYGDILTLQTGVAGASGQGTATGNVHITDAGAVLYGGAYRLNSSGYTDVRTNSLPPAQHSFVSSYDGDPSFNPSSSAAYPVNIVKANTTSSVVANTYTAADNSTVIFTITIQTSGFGYLAPSGVVSLTSNGQAIGSASLEGQSGSGANFDRSIATISVAASLFPTGTYPIVASYPGDLNYNPSTATTSQPVTVTNSGLPITHTVLSVSPQVVAPNGSIVFSAIVTATPSTGINGAVQFAIDGQNVSRAVMANNGVWSEPISVAGFASGSHTATAIYSGDSTHKSSVSNHAAFVITGATGPTMSTTNINVSPATAEQGTGVQIVASVVPQVPGTPTPTGTIQLLVDNNFNGAPLALSLGAKGSFTLVTSVLQVGLHTATVYYAGDSVYMPSYSQPMSFTIVAPGSAPTTVTIANVPPLVGAGVTFPFTATVHTNSSNATPPTGTLEVIVDKGAPLPQTNLAVNPEGLMLDTTGLALGVHNVTVYYSGDPTYTAATSAATSFTIIPANSTFTLSPGVTSSHIGIDTGSSTPVTFTVTPTVGGSFPVSFTCSNLPAGLGCSFAPATVNVAGLTSVSTVLTVVPVNAVALFVPHSPGGRALYTAFGGISFAGLLLCFVPARRRRLSSLLALIVLATLVTASGCSGGIAPERGPYAVTVTATSAASALGITTRTAVVNLTIGGPPATP